MRTLRRADTFVVRARLDSEIGRATRTEAEPRVAAESLRPAEAQRLRRIGREVPEQVEVDQRPDVRTDRRAHDAHRFAAGPQGAETLAIERPGLDADARVDRPDAGAEDTLLAEPRLPPFTRPVAQSRPFRAIEIDPLADELFDGDVAVQRAGRVLSVRRSMLLRCWVERGRLPDINSADAWEKRMAEGVAALARYRAQAKAAQAQGGAANG